MSKTKTEKARVEELLDAAKPTNDLIAKAKAKRDVELEEKRLASILKEMEAIDKVVNSAVANLRDARKIEERARKNVMALDAARNQYNIDADYSKFIKAAAEAGYFTLAFGR